MLSSPWLAQMHELKRERTRMESEKDVLEQELLNTDTLLAEKREKVQAERMRVKQGEEQVAELKGKVGHLHTGTGSFGETTPSERRQDRMSLAFNFAFVSPFLLQMTRSGQLSLRTLQRLHSGSESETC